ncbi:MAG: glycerate kinase [Phycisphaerae bacterium]|nr:glycerate kinase [Phycisphaerae bacterium]
MRILIAPDKFKDALDAAGVAAALAVGVRAARPGAEILICPLGDGGEGTGRLLAEALGAEQHTARVLDPLGRPCSARWWLCPDRNTAIIEMAEASGLALLSPVERDAVRTTSFGTGQLLKAACEAGCTRVLLCVGGSATVDGGTGCLQALGWEFTDTDGGMLKEPIMGGMLTRIATLRPAADPPSMNIDILCDVDNPLLGPRGAAPVFAPQKGASPTAVQKLEHGLENWARVLESSYGRDVSAIPGGGAAGGLPAGLAATLEAQLLSGFDEVARHVNLRDKLKGCDLCLTGEGRIDDQTVGGKVVAGVARLAARQGVPTVAFAGAVDMRAAQTIEALAEAIGVTKIVVVTPPETTLAVALATTATNLHNAAQCLCRTFEPRRS